jgi:pSer/pThr/pTyr-binding forkhead associated (FHA) protein
VLKFAFLALLYFFVYRSLRSVVVEVSGGTRTARPRRGEPRPPAPPRTAARRRGKAPRKVIVMNDKGAKTGTVPLNGTIQIGRADACHIRLDDTYISQFHARIFPRDGAWYVEDLGSTNGTYLNQRKLTGASEVRAGDTLRMGKTTMELKS